MSYDFKEITFLASAKRVASENSIDFDVSKYSEMVVFFEVTGQGVFSTDTLDVVLKTKSPGGNYHEKGSFTQVKDVSSSLPHYETLEVANLGKTCRIETTMTGIDSTESYTYSVTGVAKRII